jgi:hypothetical protein
VTGPRVDEHSYETRSGLENVRKLEITYNRRNPGESLANFEERRRGEVRRTPLLRGWLNKSEKSEKKPRVFRRGVAGYRATSLV